MRCRFRNLKLLASVKCEREWNGKRDKEIQCGENNDDVLDNLHDQQQRTIRNVIISSIHRTNKLQKLSESMNRVMEN